MKYELVKSSRDDIDRLIEYKKRNIYEYANDLSKEEIYKINSYVTSEVPKLISNYCNIIVDDKIIGCLLLTDKDNGILLDEIYIEEEYRNKGIGTSVIKDVISKNKIIYLWVYKDNFTFDDEVIENSLNVVDEISKKISIDEFEIYFGQLPEQGFALDYHYGKYVNGTIIKTSLNNSK